MDQKTNNENINVPQDKTNSTRRNHCKNKRIEKAKMVVQHTLTKR